MARRPRKSPDPSLDLSRYLHPLESLECPWNPSCLFEHRPPAGPGDRHGAPASAEAALRPVELEVGSGKGLFLTTAAADRPDHDFVGVEVAKPYAALCAAKLARLRLPNAVMIAGDAGVLARHILADACLAAVHVYFPDPWWKARHRKRRVLSAEFLAHAARAVQPGGALHVWTDVEEYFRESLSLAAATGSYESPRELADEPPGHDLDYRTHFERRTRIAGGSVWRAVLVRNATPPCCSRIPLPPTADD
jgi:tRNA (guanine-N7-)-methyltransferase